MGGSIGGNTSLMLVGDGDGPGQLPRHRLRRRGSRLPGRPPGGRDRARTPGTTRRRRSTPRTCMPSRGESAAAAHPAAAGHVVPRRLRARQRSGLAALQDMSIVRSRFDRYEIYSPFERCWTTAIDLEQISFSVQDDPFTWREKLQPDANLTTTTTSRTRSTTAPSRWPAPSSSQPTARLSSGWTPGRAFIEGTSWRCPPCC